ncbi:MAG: hypothetical protein ACRDIZ_06950 [Actinomycetota bacterium]
MESRTASIVALHDRRSDVDRRRLRAQALAELRALSRRDQEPDAADAYSRLRRTIVLP